MNINGLQKLTLLDYPGKTACTVFLAGCDMRCPFCHNSELLDGAAPALMDDKELLAFLNTRIGLLDGVAITGGEPLLRKDLPDLLREIKKLGFSIKLDTNGFHPETLKAILDKKLIDYVAMDIKNSPEKYAQTCGLENVDISKVQQSIELIKNSSIMYEFRTTVVNELHDESSFEGISAMIAGASQYFLQAFVDRDSVLYTGFTSPDKEKLERFAKIVEKTVVKVQIRGV